MPEKWEWSLSIKIVYTFCVSVEKEFPLLQMAQNIVGLCLHAFFWDVISLLLLVSQSSTVTYKGKKPC